MGVLYFIPSRRFLDGAVPDSIEDSLPSYGLGHLAGASYSQRPVIKNGPNGGAGFCLGLRLPKNKTGVYKDKQTWVACESGDLYIGWYTEDGKPGPEEFRREGLPATKWNCKLEDGNVWEFMTTDALPKVLGYDSGGNPCSEAREQDAQHWESSEWLYNFLVAGTMDTTMGEIFGHITNCLAARYHISIVEAAALRLYHTDTYSRALLTALGIETSAKKNETETE